MKKYRKQIWYRNILIAVVVAFGLAVFIGFYKTHAQVKLETAVAEHARILSRPLWNYDRDSIEGSFRRLSPATIIGPYASIS